MAYIAFKLIAAVVALLLFPIVTRLMLRASDSVDPVTLLAAYHTGYNAVGVAILLPLIGPFTRLIERIVPERAAAFTQCLDPASLAAPTVAVEAVRRTVARVLDALGSSAAVGLDGAGRGGLGRRSTVDRDLLDQTTDVLQQSRTFLSKLTDPLASEEERQWFVSTLHALDHTTRLAEVIDNSIEIEVTSDATNEPDAVALCATAMRSAVAIAAPLARLSIPPSEMPGRTLWHRTPRSPRTLLERSSGPAARSPPFDARLGRVR